MPRPISGLSTDTSFSVVDVAKPGDRLHAGPASPGLAWINDAMATARRPAASPSAATIASCWATAPQHSPTAATSAGSHCESGKFESRLWCRSSRLSA